MNSVFFKMLPTDYSVTNIYIYIYISFLLSGRYYRYFGISCPGHVGEEVRKRTKFIIRLITRIDS